MRWLCQITFILNFTLLVSCASTSGGGDSSSGSYNYIPELDGKSRANGAAFAADAMHLRSPMPNHPEWKPIEFYFKHCSEIGDEAFYSKTSYECTDPY